MKYCNNCGAKLVKNANYCGECGSKIDKNGKIEDGNWKYYLLINAILIFCAFFLPFGNKYMLPAALVILVTAKIKYPKNTIVSVVFWLELVSYIVLVIFLAILMVACIKSCTALV